MPLNQLTTRKYHVTQPSDDESRAGKVHGWNSDPLCRSLQEIYERSDLRPTELARRAAEFLEPDEHGLRQFSRMHVYDILVNGTRTNPGANVLNALAKALGVRPLYVTEDEFRAIAPVLKTLRKWRGG